MKTYTKLKIKEFKKKEIYSMIELDKSQFDATRLYAWIIKNCINPNSNIMKIGMRHIAVPFCPNKGKEDKRKEDCYHAFLWDYARGCILKNYV